MRAVGSPAFLRSGVLPSASHSVMRSSERNEVPGDWGHGQPTSKKPPRYREALLAKMKIHRSKSVFWDTKCG